MAKMKSLTATISGIAAVSTMGVLAATQQNNAYADNLPTSKVSASAKATNPALNPSAQKYTDWVITLKSNSNSAKVIKEVGRNADPTSKLDSQIKKHLEDSASAHGVALKGIRANSNNRMTIHLSKAVDSSMAKTLAGNSEIAVAEPDITAYSMGTTSTPNDPYYYLQWDITGTYGVHANSVWPTYDGTGQTIAVLDTGYTDAPDLTSKIVGGYDFISSATAARDGDARDADAHDMGDWTVADQCSTGSAAENSSWHGTQVASVAAGATNNGVGTAGVAPGAMLEPVRVLGACGGSSVDIADAITWASGGTVSGIPNNPNPAKILNLSLGGSYSTCPTYYQSAIDGAISRGATVVVAAGNGSTSTQNSTPANCTGVISVAATDSNGVKASFSNSGGPTTLAAPGVQIAGSWNSGTTTPSTTNYAYMSGTSQATPHVSGIVALMRQANPNLTPAQITSILKSTATTTTDSTLGAGIANAQTAVAAAQSLASGSSSASATPSSTPTTTSSTSTTPSATSTPTSTSTATSTSTPTSSATATATSTPTATATSPSATSTPTTSATATSTPTPAASLTAPTSAKRGTTITLTANHFAANENVTFYFDGHSIARVRANSSGTASLNYAISSRTTVGTHTVKAIGYTSGKTATASLSIS